MLAPGGGDSGRPILPFSSAQCRPMHLVPEGQHWPSPGWMLRFLKDFSLSKIESPWSIQPGWCRRSGRCGLQKGSVVGTWKEGQRGWWGKALSQSLAAPVASPSLGRGSNAIEHPPLPQRWELGGGETRALEGSSQSG